MNTEITHRAKMFGVLRTGESSDHCCSDPGTGNVVVQENAVIMALKIYASRDEITTQQ